MKENLEFTSVIHNKAERFIRNSLSITSLINQADNEDYDGESIAFRLNKGLEEFFKDQYKTVFLTYILNHFSDTKTQAVDTGYIGTLGYGNFPNEKPIIDKTLILISEVIFEAAQQLETLGLEISPDNFSKEEYKHITDTLKSIIEKLEIIKVGNSILGEQIEELQEDIKDLKTSMIMGKKPFYQRMTGIVANYVATKGADEVWDKIKPLFYEILADFMKKYTLEHFVKSIK